MKKMTSNSRESACLNQQISDSGGRYDIIFMNGVHSIFDPGSCGKWLKPLTSALKNSDPRLYVFGIFNPFDIDVRVSSRNCDRKQDEWETGWNLVSKKTINNWCVSNGFKTVFTDFDLGIDIDKHPHDPLRSFTKRMVGGGDSY